MRKHQIVIIGGGTAGITTAAALRRKSPKLDIAIIDPAKKHYYQPMFTLIGGGASAYHESVRDLNSLVPAGVALINEFVTGFEPEANVIKTSGEDVEYQHMVVCPGIQINWESIEGLSTDLIGTNGITSNYCTDKVEATWESIQEFTGGTAIFTFPSTPIKCAGAPQKIMWMMEHYLQRKGIRNNARIVFATAVDKLFGVDKYRKALEKLASERGVEVLYKHNLVSISAKGKTATFATPEGENKIPFDFIHIAPPMSAPDFIAKSPLANEMGWIDVDKNTTRHVRFSNIFGIGDASSLPTSKTGAAIRKQVPVLVDHLLNDINGGVGSASYNGYTSCPLVTGYGRLILAEFDYEGKPCETFPIDQGKERLSMYVLKKHGLPKLYWNGMLKGFC